MEWFTFLMVVIFVVVNLEARWMYPVVTDLERLKYVKTQLTAVSVNLVAVFYAVIVQCTQDDYKMFDGSPRWLTSLVFGIIYACCIILTRAAWKSYMRYRPATKAEGKRMAGIKDK